MLAGAVIVASIVGIRPWHRRWGRHPRRLSGRCPTTSWRPSRSRRPLTPYHQGSRRRYLAVAGPAGAGSGWLYSYQWLENLAGCQMRNTDRIIPERQHLQVGDLVRLGPGPYPAYTVTTIEPGRA
jgi:hypothetical protein